MPSVSLLHCNSRTLLRTILASQISFAFQDMFANFERHIDKHGECKFILADESGKFKEERIGGHLPMFKVFQNPSAEIGFGATLSAYHRQPTFGIGEH